MLVTFEEQAATTHPVLHVFDRHSTTKQNLADDHTVGLAVDLTLELNRKLLSTCFHGLHVVSHVLQCSQCQALFTAFGHTINQSIDFSITKGRTFIDDLLQRFDCITQSSSFLFALVARLQFRIKRSIKLSQGSVVGLCIGLGAQGFQHTQPEVVHGSLIRHVDVYSP